MKTSAMATTGDTYSKLFLEAASPARTAAKATSTRPGSVPKDAVSVDLSAPHDVFAAVDNFFDLNKSGKQEMFDSLSPEEKGQALKMVAELTKTGYVGYETLQVNNKIERHDIIMQIGDDRLRNARVYHDPRRK